MNCKLPLKMRWSLQTRLIPQKVKNLFVWNGRLLKMKDSRARKYRKPYWTKVVKIFLFKSSLFLHESWDVSIQVECFRVAILKRGYFEQFSSPEGARSNCAGAEASCSIADVESICQVFFWNVNRPFAGIGQVSVYLLFLRGLRRKRSSAKGFRESLWINFKGTKVLFEALSYLPQWVVLLFM